MQFIIKLKSNWIFVALSGCCRLLAEGVAVAQGIRASLSRKKTYVVDFPGDLCQKFGNVEEKLIIKLRDCQGFPLVRRTHLKYWLRNVILQPMDLQSISCENVHLTATVFSRNQNLESLIGNYVILIESYHNLVALSRVYQFRRMLCGINFTIILFTCSASAAVDSVCPKMFSHRIVLTRWKLLISNSCCGSFVSSTTLVSELFSILNLIYLFRAVKIIVFRNRVSFQCCLIANEAEIGLHVGGIYPQSMIIQGDSQTNIRTNEGER